jgi:hypothetical protein
MPEDSINNYNLVIGKKTYNCLGMVEFHTSSKPALCKEAQL